MAALKVCLLSPGLPGADPADAAGQHARRLAGHEGVEVTLALTEHRPAGDSAARFGDARVVAIEATLPAGWRVGLAPSWGTRERVCSGPAGRPAYLVDHFARQRLADWQSDRPGRRAGPRARRTHARSSPRWWPARRRSSPGA